MWGWLWCVLGWWLWLWLCVRRCVCVMMLMCVVWCVCCGLWVWCIVEWGWRIGCVCIVWVWRWCWWMLVCLNTNVSALGRTRGMMGCWREVWLCFEGLNWVCCIIGWRIWMWCIWCCWWWRWRTASGECIADFKTRTRACGRGWYCIWLSWGWIMMGCGDILRWRLWDICWGGCWVCFWWWSLRRSDFESRAWRRSGRRAWEIGVLLIIMMKSLVIECIDLCMCMMWYWVYCLGCLGIIMLLWRCFKTSRASTSSATVAAKIRTVVILSGCMFCFLIILCILVWKCVCVICCDCVLKLCDCVV